MIIVADENIPLITEPLGGVGEVRLVHGRHLKREDLKEADALLVRSITRVNEELLRDTPVKFVGTATIGTDHLDIDYLTANGIRWAGAAGSNARSVAEYVVAAVLELAEAYHFRLEGKTIGVVGVGNTGRGVVRFAPHLGLRVLENDPPLERAGAGDHWVNLDTVLAESDFVTLHVPLNRGGVDRTEHLIGRAQLDRMKDGAFLINSSRGAVVNNGALLDALNENRIGGAVLDVWENEPRINRDLLGKVAFGTPHIAGYSLDGKINGTRMIADALCRFFEVEQKCHPAPPEVEDSRVLLPEDGAFEDVLAAAVRHAYSLQRDDLALRAGTDLPDDQFGSFFDGLRREYPARREFRNYEFDPKTTGERERAALRGLGFEEIA